MFYATTTILRQAASDVIEKSLGTLAERVEARYATHATVSAAHPVMKAAIAAELRKLGFNVQYNAE